MHRGKGGNSDWGSVWGRRCRAQGGGGKIEGGHWVLLMAQFPTACPMLYAVAFLAPALALCWPGSGHALVAVQEEGGGLSLGSGETPRWCPVLAVLGHALCLATIWPSPEI